MPRRDHYFFGELGGNQIVNQNTTAYVNSTFNGTVWGKSGRYDEVALSKKVYGNPTQSATSLGNLTDQSVSECSNRTVLIAVTATTDAATLSINLSNVAFYKAPVVETPKSSANFLSMTFAAVLGLVSLAFF